MGVGVGPIDKNNNIFIVHVDELFFFGHDSHRDLLDPAPAVPVHKVLVPGTDLRRHRVSVGH